MMPQLTNYEKKEKIYLPSTASAESEDEKAWVVLDTSPIRTGDVQILDQGMTFGEYEMKILLQRLKEWNYTDVNGDTLPITFENIGMLDIDDFKFLQTKIPKGKSNLDTEEKKTSSVTSSPPETIKVQEL